MQATQNFGAVDPLTGNATAVGYTAVVAGQQVTITATPNDPNYTWTAVATVTPTNIATTVQ